MDGVVMADEARRVRVVDGREGVGEGVVVPFWACACDMEREAAKHNSSKRLAGGAAGVMLEVI